uniref:Uncharacterized protein n=1 Tax=Oryzias melastigma TaxID=30732 RepID=A0A3B3CCY1_ORYME
MSMTDIKSYTIEATTVGIFVAREDQTMDYSDVGIRLEGQIVITDLDNIALALAMLFGLFYALNLRYSKAYQHTFEVFQKILMGLEPTGLSRKAQCLKTKICGQKISKYCNDVLLLTVHTECFFLH